MCQSLEPYLFARRLPSAYQSTLVARFIVCCIFSQEKHIFFEQIQPRCVISHSSINFPAQESSMVAHWLPATALHFCHRRWPFRSDVFSARDTARRAKITPETGMRAGPIWSRFLPYLTAASASQPGGPGAFHEGALVFAMAVPHSSKEAGLRWPNALCNCMDFRRPFRAMVPRDLTQAKA